MLETFAFLAVPLFGGLLLMAYGADQIIKWIDKQDQNPEPCTKESEI